MESPITFYNTNQDQFTFLVFKKDAVDNFFRKYKPLRLSNKILIQEFRDSLLSQKFEVNKTDENHVDAFAKNTKQLSMSDLNLAKNVLNATLKNGGNKYFPGSLDYLFFHECLPQKFKYKWPQSTLGHFEFNSTFFALLRDKSKELDNLIYGEIGFWDKNIQMIFGEYTFNEITPEIAENIKHTITSDKVFNNPRFASDRANFLEFLDNTINKEWRLILIDWN